MTSSHNIIVRSLELSDISQAVGIHQAAFPNFFLTFLGPDFLKLLYTFYAKGCTEIALAGTYHGQVVGTLLGTTQPVGFYKRLVTRHFFPFAWTSIRPLLRKPSIFPRLMRALCYRGDTPPIVGKGTLLASICTEPAFQGRGVGRQLVTVFESKAWAAGAQFVYLTTDRNNNQTTRRFYENLGWSVEAEFVTLEGRPMVQYRKEAP